jgi:hypothetical protein
MRGGRLDDVGGQGVDNLLTTMTASRKAEARLRAGSDARRTVIVGSKGATLGDNSEAIGTVGQPTLRMGVPVVAGMGSERVGRWSDPEAAAAETTRPLQLILGGASISLRGSVCRHLSCGSPAVSWRPYRCSAQGEPSPVVAACGIHWHWM